jgi:tetrahydromethanopterin S-methyltransferase subunit F
VWLRTRPMCRGDLETGIRHIGIDKRTNSNCSRITSKPEVISSSVGLVSRNALVLSGLANSWIVGKPEVILGPEVVSVVCQRLESRVAGRSGARDQAMTRARRLARPPRTAKVGDEGRLLPASSARWLPDSNLFPERILTGSETRANSNRKDKIAGSS